MVTVFALGSKGLNAIKNLKETYSTGFIAQVVTARDKSITNDFYDEILAYCNELNIPVCDRSSIPGVKTKFVFAVAWRWLINNVGAQQVIVFHDSLLPRYRGYSPLVNCLVNGEKEIGVTALFADDSYDKGDIIYQSKTEIEYPIKISDAITKIAFNYEACLQFVADKIYRGELIIGLKQIETDATYSLWRNEDDYKIDWSMEAAKICRLIDATGTPYKGAFTWLHKKMIRITDAMEIDDVRIEIRDTGKIIFLRNEKPVIVCGRGLLLIKEAIYDDTKESIFPLKQFRIRFS